MRVDICKLMTTALNVMIVLALSLLSHRGVKICIVACYLMASARTEGGRLLSPSGQTRGNPWARHQRARAERNTEIEIRVTTELLVRDYTRRSDGNGLSEAGKNICSRALFLSADT